MKKEAVDAAAVLAEKVYAPVFLTKLASIGIVPQNEEEANALYELAVQLKMAAHNQLGISTVVETDPEMNCHARKVLQEEEGIKTAALKLAENMDLAENIANDNLDAE